MFSRWLCLSALCCLLAAGEDKPAPDPPKPETKAETRSDARTELNLAGKVDTQSGESRRNENVQFNLIDNNTRKELNSRLGTSATIVEEFRPDQNFFGVEFGNLPPALLFVPAGKVSALHGSVYETHNNSVFSARSFFQVGGVKAAHQNDYGFTVSSPLWSGAFLTLDASQQKIRGSVNGNILVPEPDERTPLTTDPAARAIIERFFSAFPLEAPNRTDIDPRALNTNSPQTIDTNNASGQIDQLAGRRDRFSIRYAFVGQQVDAFELLKGQNPDTTTKSHSSRLAWERAWSPETEVNLALGFDRVHSLLVPEPNTIGPSVSFSGVIDPLGPSSTLPIDRVQNRFRYAGVARRIHGHHIWTFGVELDRIQINGRESSSNRGVWTFRSDFGNDALTNFRLGLPSRFSFGAGNLDRGFRSWDQQYSVGDHWRLSPTLTLNYGLRYQPITAPTEVNNLTRIPYHCDCNNLGPQFGFAWRLPGRWGVLRGAYGLQYAGIYAVTFQQLRWDPPNFLKVEVQEPSLTDPLAGVNLNPATARSTVFEVPPNLVSPYTHEYNFSWDLSTSTKWKLQLGYVGSRTEKLFMIWFDNRAVPVPGVPQTLDTIEARRPDQSHYEIRQVENSSRAYFDAARVSFILPNWRGLSLDAAYWFSKALDLGATYTNTAAGDDAAQGRSQSQDLVSQDLKGPSSFDQTHSLLAHLNYRLPLLASSPSAVRGTLGKWNLSAVFLAKTGPPFTVVSGSDGPGYGNVDGSPGDRPDLLDPSILGRTISNPSTSVKLLPASAFAFIGPNETRGNLGTGTFRRGGIRNLNAAISRTWNVAREKSLTFRAESINFLNTPQFAEPGVNLTSPSFGQITNTYNDGRTFQFQLRFRF
jgi:hypothetical protein